MQYAVSNSVTLLKPKFVVSHPELTTMHFYCAITTLAKGFCAGIAGWSKSNSLHDVLALERSVLSNLKQLPECIDGLRYTTSQCSVSVQTTS